MAFRAFSFLILLLTSSATPCSANGDQCTDNGGKCVADKNCDPNNLLNDCDAALCVETDRTCKTKNSCKRTKQCNKRLGVCVENCKTVKGMGQACTDKCAKSSSCKCLICRPDEQCTAAGGKCATNCLDDDFFACDAGLCSLNDGCNCKIPKQVDCVTSDKCNSKLGDCVFPCVASKGQKCSFKWCTESGDGCACLRTKKCPRSNECTAAGGTCKKNCVEVLGGNTCDESICPNKGCACKILKDTPSQLPSVFSSQPPSASCKDISGNCFGECVRDCVPDENFGCRKEWCNSEDCSCKSPLVGTCYQNNYCLKDLGGTCVDNCIPGSGWVCVGEFCSEDSNCSCKFKPCQQPSQCSNVGGLCVKNCVPDDGTDCVDDLCPDSEECSCSKPACEQSSECDNLDGRCKKNCVSSGDIVCASDLCPGSENCSCSIGPCRNNIACGWDLGGKCVNNADCVPGAGEDCLRGVCPSSACSCKACQQTTPCQRNNGQCTKNCVPSDNSVSGVSIKCVDGLCPDSDDCKCKFESCAQTEECHQLDGSCELNCKPGGGYKCLNEYCCKEWCSLSRRCKCKYKSCQQTPQCQKQGGECVHDCVPSFDLECDGNLCPESEFCSCKKPRRMASCPLSNDCQKKGGICISPCFAEQGKICNSELCDNECDCLYMIPTVDTGGGDGSSNHN